VTVGDVEDRPRLLIEEWLPVIELGIESQRERSAANDLPPLNYHHIWWARRPLVASAGVILAGLLPAWAPAVADAAPDAKQLASPDAYHAWVLRLCGVIGNAKKGQAAIERERAAGTKPSANPYGYPKAYKNSPGPDDVEVLHRLLRWKWGGELPLIVDPTAGGGSIPLAAARLDLPVIANDLNPVAAAILHTSISIPARRDADDLLVLVQRWGKELIQRIEARLSPYFPSQPGERVTNYLYAWSVACPRTNRPVPLVPDWWLSRKGGGVAAKMVTEVDDTELDTPRFEVLSGEAIDFDPTQGTFSGGRAISPYDHLIIDGRYIKTEAKEGRMQPLLYAVITKRNKERIFRAPVSLDRDALVDAEKELERVRVKWDSTGILPTEEIDPTSNYDRGHRMYGLQRWVDFYSSRQLLSHGVFVDELRSLADEMRGKVPSDTADAVLCELALMQAKALNYNAVQSSWNVNKQAIRSVFDKHNFAFKWTFAEMEAAHDLYDFALSQLLKSFGGLVDMLATPHLTLESARPVIKNVTVTCSNAADLAHIEAGSVAQVCMDPPYYDNVMYAELADFFYVWEKRTLGRFLPEFFTSEVTDKDNEAVANQARFTNMGARKKELADADYEAKMTAIFAECRRILRDDGVLVVMFTHKRAEAWDTLGMGLLQAEFTIETSWPVNTEPANSSHQAHVNAAASTIMLVCRKRGADNSATQVFFEDIEADVRHAAREALRRFAGSGLAGVDLLLSTYGPVLSVISRHWPVYSSHADEEGRARLLRPEEALDAARAEVVRLQRSRLVGRVAHLDTLTDFTVLAWDTFKASEFPFDDARRLALAVGGLDMDELVRARIVEQKSGMVRLLEPRERLRRGDSELPGVRPTADRFLHPVDAAHTVLYVADVDGLPAAKALMDRTGLTHDQEFLGSLQGLINAIPRTKVKGEWVYPEANLLDRLVATYLPGIAVPADSSIEPEYEQQNLLTGE
jgi:putative DNA methylase